MAVLLTRRAVVQAAMETTYGTPVSVGANDGVLVSNPDFTVNPDLLKREFVQADLSPQPAIMGRMIATMKFTTELRSNGLTDTGIAANAPIITRLFRACGYALSARTTDSISPVYPVGTLGGNVVNWASGGTPNVVDLQQYRLVVTTAGASAAAKITIYGDVASENSAALTVTSGTAITLGTSAATVTPTFTGTLALGQSWVVWVQPSGIVLDPVSDNFESITLAMNKGGVLHTMPGALGTFQIRAEAGKYATIDWTFTGLYTSPVDAALVVANYEKTLPAMVEMAKFSVEGFNAIAKTFTFDQKNEVQIREDMNSAQGFIGTRITDRNSDGGVDPEADNVANYDFWGAMSAARVMPFKLRVGKTAGNIVWFLAPSTQYTGLTYRDRNGILTYDAGLAFSRSYGNDEVRIIFC